jgi:hypothetical protein
LSQQLDGNTQVGTFEFAHQRAGRTAKARMLAMNAITLGPSSRPGPAPAPTRKQDRVASTVLS